MCYCCMITTLRRGCRSRSVPTWSQSGASISWCTSPPATISSHTAICDLLYHIKLYFRRGWWTSWKRGRVLRRKPWTWLNAFWRQPYLQEWLRPRSVDALILALWLLYWNAWIAEAEGCPMLSIVTNIYIYIYMYIQCINSVVIKLINWLIHGNNNSLSHNKISIVHRICGKLWAGQHRQYQFILLSSLLML